MPDHADAPPALGSWLHVSMTVNEEPIEVTVPADRRLASFLREDLRLTGTKVACEVGVCGACTVLVDGRLVSSCLTLVAQVDGAQVTTIEGLDDHPEARRLRASFAAEGGFQCGFCTSGQLVAATALLAETRDAPLGRKEIAEHLTGNLCRCTGYYGIVRAVQAAQS